MATITFVAPGGGVVLNSNWITPDHESIGSIAKGMAEAISRGGAWVIADGADGGATATFLPVGTSIGVRFDSPLVPNSLRGEGFVLGEAD